MRIYNYYCIGVKKQDEHLLSDIRDFRGMLKKAPPPRKNLVVVRRSCF